MSETGKAGLLWGLVACIVVALQVFGQTRAYYGDESYLLEEGDSLLWDGTVPHRMENIGDGDAQLLIALAPAAFLGHAEEGRTQGSEVAPGDTPRHTLGA